MDESSESEKLFGDIREYLKKPDETEASKQAEETYEQRQRDLEKAQFEKIEQEPPSIKKVAKLALIGLGYAPSLRHIEEMIAGTGILGAIMQGMNDLRPNQGFDATIEAVARTIKTVPDPDEAKKLLLATISPEKAEIDTGKEGILLSFRVAAPSDKSIQYDLNPVRPDAAVFWEPQPEDTRVIVAKTAVITGFGENQKVIEDRLKRARTTTLILTNNDYPGWQMQLKQSESKDRNKTALDWATKISIVRT